MPTRLWVVVGPEWERTAKALGAADQKLPSWLHEEMRDAVDPLVNQAKARVLNVGVRGGPAGHTGLRGRVAAGVRVREGMGRSNPYVRVYTRMAERDESPIPRGLDQASGWRHPLFGNKRHWFTSTPDRTGWFTDTIGDGEDKIAHALDEALERAARLIASA